MSTLNTDSEETQPAVPLAIRAEILDPSSDKRIAKAVFGIFVYHLLTLLSSADIYTFLTDVSGSILYIFIMTSTFLVTLYRYLSSVEVSVIYTNLQNQRGRGLHQRVRLSMDPQNPRLASRTDISSLLTNNKAATEVDSLVGQNREVSAGYSNDSEYNPLQNLAPVVDQTDSTNIPAKPLSKTSTPSINSSTSPPPAPSSGVLAPTPSLLDVNMNQQSPPPLPRSSILTSNTTSSTASPPSMPRSRPPKVQAQDQVPAGPPISPTDDGRLYHIPPHRHDTEADLGIRPTESPSSHSSGPSITGDLYPEPEELTRGVASGVNASSETIVGEGGVRRLATVEIPGKADDAGERICEG